MNAQFARALWQLKQQEKKMKKSEFVKLVQSKLNADASLKAADRAVDAVFSALKDVLLAGDRYSHPNFGTFYTTELEARNARNIRSGEQIEVPARIDCRGSDRLRLALPSKTKFGTARRKNNRCQ